MVPISVKRHHYHDISYEGKHLWLVAYSFRGLVHYYYHAGRHGAGAEVLISYYAVNIKWSETLRLA